MAEAPIRRRRILLLLLEFVTWERGRPLSYSAQFAIEDALVALGAEVVTVPAFNEIRCTDRGSWLSRLDRLCGDEAFDMVWLWMSHSHLDEQLLTWLSKRAPIRVGFLIESLRYTDRELAQNGTLRRYRTQVMSRLPHLTHLLAVDEVDVDELDGLDGVPVFWWPGTAPRRALIVEPRKPVDSRAVFSGVSYWERTTLLADPRLQRLLALAQGVEERLGLAAVYDRLMLGMYVYLADGGRADRLDLQRWVGAWRTLRRAVFDAYASSLQHWSAVVALPSFVKTYASRLGEAMAAGRPIVVAEIADRPRNRALFEDGEDMLLLDPARPDDLRDRLEQLAASPDLAARLTWRARARLEAFHTTDVRVRQVMEWIEHGLPPDYGERSFTDDQLVRLAAAAREGRPVDTPSTVDDVMAAISALPLPSMMPDAVRPILTPELAVVLEGGSAVSINNWAACLETLARLGDRDVFCWGAGARGRALVRAVAAAGFNVAGFLDSDVEKAGRSTGDVIIHGPDLLAGRSGGESRPFVFVASVGALQIVRALDSYGFHAPLDVLVV